MNNIGVLSVSTTLISSAADQYQPDDESSRPKEFHILAPHGSNAGGEKDDCEGDSPVEEKDSPVKEKDSPVEYEDNQSNNEVIGECLNGACIKALFCEPLSLFYCRPCSHIWW